MAQSPQAWRPIPSSRGPETFVIAFVVVIVLILFFFVFLLFFAGATGFMLSGGFAAIVCLPAIFVIVVIVLAIASSQGRRQIPPPPPIQQPMVPAGQQGPVALNCPNCGGPPQNVDRFGVATCGYCGTRFLVR